MSIAAPLELHRDRVRPEWIDYNGHFNVAYYVLVFDQATDTFFDYLGMGEAYIRESGQSTFAAEMHVTYVRELREGDALTVATRLLDFDAKRIHFFHQMYHAGEGYLAATSEHLGLNVDMKIRRVTAMPADVLERLGRIREAHSMLPRPPQIGSVMGIQKSAG